LLKATLDSENDIHISSEVIYKTFKCIRYASPSGEIFFVVSHAQGRLAPTLGSNILPLRGRKDWANE